MVPWVHDLGQPAAELHEPVTFGIGCVTRTQRVMKPLDLGWLAV